MAVEQFSNAPQTTLTSELADGVDTSVDVASFAGFPAAAQYRILIESELMLVTAGAGTLTWTVTRGVEGTAAVAHSNGSTVTHVLTAGALAQFQTDTLFTLGDGKPYIWHPPASANAKDDEFIDLSGQSGPNNGLDAKWSKHNLGTAAWLKLSNAEAPGCLLLDIPTGQSADQHIYQATPAGDFTIMAYFTVGFCTSRQMWGVNILDSNGAGMGLCWDQGTLYVMRVISNWQQTAAATSLGSNCENGGSHTFWLKKDGTTYRGSIAIGDRRIRTFFEAANVAGQTFTPAYITFGRIYGTGIARIALDAFRVS